MTSDSNALKQLLKKDPIYSDLTEEELEEILNITQLTNYEKNQLVFSQNQEAQFLFVVAEGEFLLNMPNSDYKIFTRGDIFGEIAIINKNLRTGSVRAKSTAAAYTICGIRLFKPEFIKPMTTMKVVRAMAVKISNYLRSREQTSTVVLIREGENEHVEFKSSLRWNKHINKRDQAIEHAALKTIAAFLNAEGGTLLIGVNDEGEILGLKEDQFLNEDKMLLHLNKLIKDKLGTIFTTFVNAEVESIRGKQVLRIDCEASTMPAYLKERNNELFYVRTGPASTAMKLSKVYDYIKLRFDNRP